MTRDTSRRAALRWGLCAAAAGLGPTWLPACAGLRRERPAEAVVEVGEPAVSPQPAIDPAFEPPYLALHRSGELRRRGEALWAAMERCSLCPRQCGARRHDGEAGFCGASATLEVSSFHPHLGEEACLVGQNGSGTIFLSNCNLRCVFCINWETSQGGLGWPKELDALAQMMLDLQAIGCHNVNLVTPTHYTAHIVRALDLAAVRGLRVPLVWNTCGWELPETLAQLDGVVDIYMPDFKYASGTMAATYSSGADRYPEVTEDALLEMHRQVGVARPAEDGLLYRGLIVRHLVMPNNVGGSAQVMRWIGANLPADTYVHVMSQYRPMHRADEFPEIDRPITAAEYDAAVHAAVGAGLTALDLQGSPDRWRDE